jgi:hypothetical protein
MIVAGLGSYGSGLPRGQGRGALPSKRGIRVTGSYSAHYGASAAPPTKELGGREPAGQDAIRAAHTAVGQLPGPDPRREGYWLGQPSRPSFDENQIWSGLAAMVCELRLFPAAGRIVRKGRRGRFPTAA